jgi:hypothetical protein
MKRRSLLAGLGSSVVALSGCLGESGQDATEPGEDDQNATDPGTAMPSVETVDDGQPRPNCTIEPETVEVGSGDSTETYEIEGTIPYPDPPAEFTAEQVISFVEEHERAYIRHDRFCTSDSPPLVTSFYYSVRRSWIAADDEGFTVLLTYVGGPSAGVTRDGTRWQADIGPTGVVYHLDETRAARAQFPELPRLDSERTIAEQMPDPAEDGEVVVQF